MVLPVFADPLSNHKSALDHSICVVKQQGYTPKHSGRHGTPPKNALPYKFNPHVLAFLGL